MHLTVPVVERAVGGRARWAGGRDGGSGGGEQLPRARRPRRGLEVSCEPMTNGIIDYVTLLNERDGGITA